MRQKNPLLIILGVCGGCALLVIIASVIFGVYFWKGGGKKLAAGMVNMAVDMPTFLEDLKAKNYANAATLIDVPAKKSLSANNIQKMEEEMEKKLGPLLGYSTRPDNQATNTQAVANSSMPTIEYDYQYKMTYQNGTAMATFRFVIPDYMHPSGLISDFKLEPVGAPETK